MSSDRETTRRVRSWLEEGVSTIPDRVLDAVLDQLPATPQRRPFWPVRRYSEMSTYGRLVAVAAAVVALAVAGTAFMIAGGFSPKSTNGPAAPTATPGPTAGATAASSLLGEFTACVPNNTEFKTGTDEQSVNGGITIDKRRGYTWKGSITATDPRFSGTHYYSWDGNSYSLASGDSAPGTFAEGHRIENAEGAWGGWSVGMNLADDSVNASPAILTGEGAYEGLSAVLLSIDGSCSFNFRGFLMEVPDPPVPYTGK